MSRGGAFNVTEETMTLRDVARRFARARNPKAKGIQASELFSLLRAGELRAGFYILGGTAWIDIPIGYWEGIKIEKYRKIVRDSHNPQSGSYALRGDQFPDQVARVVCDRIKPDQKDFTSSLGGVAAVIQAAGKLNEVTIKTNDFLNFLRIRGLEEKEPRGSGGRHRKEGWREICSYIAAYMVAHYKDQPAVKLKIDEAGEAIHDIATGDGVPDVPAGSTIKEQVSKAVDLLEKSAFKLKKKV
jgi:hypothetical protein